MHASSANMMLDSILVDSSRHPRHSGPPLAGTLGPDWPDRGHCPILPSVCVLVRGFFIHFYLLHLMMLCLLFSISCFLRLATLSTNEHLVLSLSLLWARCSAHELEAGSEKTVRLSNATRTWLWLPSSSALYGWGYDCDCAAGQGI